MKQDLLTRFWDKVEITKSCWNWKASKSHNGYGYFFNGIKNVRSHRFIYELFFGNIPEKMVTDHLCKNPKCVNPYHIDIVTNKDNVLRGIGITSKNKSKTHCPQGHELNGNNLYKYKNSRHCRECRRIQK